MIWSMSEAEISLDASNSISAKAVGLVSPVSPTLNGRERRSLSSCEHGGCPVIEVLAFVE